MKQRYQYSIEGGIVTHGAEPKKSPKMSRAAKAAKHRSAGKPRLTKATRAAQRPTR